MKNKLHPYLFWILLIFLAVGAVYPVIGVTALICMIAPVLMSPYKGRYWCGNFCPRGSFYDTVIGKISPNKSIPVFFRSTGFRLFMIIFIMAVFAVQMYAAWGNLSAVGEVFVRIILLTTIVGIALGRIYHQRAWCSFCPMGTLASWISAKAKPLPLKVKNSCVNCNLCMNACPMQLSPYHAKGSIEGFTHGDCLKCGRCEAKCPKQAINF